MIQVIRNLFVLVVAASIPIYASAETTLRLAYSDVESYPFQMGNGTEVSTPPGLALDVINAVAEELDLRVQYIRVPGKRVLQDIETGSVDGGFIFSYNTQRAQYANYPMHDQQPDRSKRIATIGYYFYVLQGQPLSWNGENLVGSNKKVGAHLGFSIVRELKNKNFNVYEVKTTEQLFNMLRRQRVSAIAVQDTMAQKFLGSQSGNHIKKLHPPITTKDYYLVLSHPFVENNPELANKIWQRIRDVREDIYSTHTEKYLVESLPK
ncbi:transporter substrate-binding domain-containing protein [Vibrio sp. S4M6]|uniref:substrate-binding periplasmic protein n=1 Tax=Vibrio sinus TaxID=2946865 RepID=UPI00202A401E|nr:transporter substrate-binding domain-containing protein [Vibrio sinus]MCL9782472.1 transporter substrate-binding domain-containing protein [Vibrio sinus]